MGEWIGLLTGIVGIILAVISRMSQNRYSKVAEVIITTINSLDQIIGDEGKKKVKRAVHRKSILWDNEEDVHNAVKQAEK